MKRSGSICFALGLATFVLLATAPVRSAEPKKSEGGTAGKESPPARKGTETEGKVKAVAENEIAVIETNLGTIKVKFFPDVAPKAVENFKGLAKKGYYNGIIFHRIIDAFMIQGGDPTGTGRGGQSLWGKAFEDEFSPKYRFDRKGLLAMANAGPKTNGSQFFITLVPTPHLNNKHTIFGEVISGMDVVEKIGKVKVGPGSKPLEPVAMKKVTIEPAAAAEKAAPKAAPKAENKDAPKPDEKK
jgi:cyclophilin family peptidyl-prolyl cis-trans isomerase